MVQDHHRQMLDSVISSSTRSDSASPQRDERDPLMYVPCDSCDHDFSDQGHGHLQQRHQHLHTSPTSLTMTSRAHACTECGKTFATSSGLKQHQHIHSSVKPFQCEVCLRAYTQFSNLCRHKRMHADCRQQIKCKDCGQAFSTTTSLGKHRRFCEGILKSRQHLPHQPALTSFSSDVFADASPAVGLPMTSPPDSLMGFSPNSLAAAYYNYFMTSHGAAELSALRHLYPSPAPPAAAATTSFDSHEMASPSSAPSSAADASLSSLYPQYSRLMALVRAGLVSPQSLTAASGSWSSLSGMNLPSRLAEEHLSAPTATSTPSSVSQDTIARHLMTSSSRHVTSADSQPHRSGTSVDCPRSSPSSSLSSAAASSSARQTTTPTHHSPVKAEEATPSAAASPQQADNGSSSSSSKSRSSEIRRPWTESEPSTATGLDGKRFSDKHLSVIVDGHTTPKNYIVPSPCNTLLPRDAASRSKIRKPYPTRFAPYPSPSLSSSASEERENTESSAQDLPLDLTLRQEGDEVSIKSEAKPERHSTVARRRSSDSDTASQRPDEQRQHHQDHLPSAFLPPPPPHLPSVSSHHTAAKLDPFAAHAHAARAALCFANGRDVDQLLSVGVAQPPSPPLHFDMVTTPPLLSHLRSSAALNFALAASRPPTFAGLMDKFEQQSRLFGLHRAGDGGALSAALAAAGGGKCRDRYGCKFCGKVFPRSANLTRHLRTHTGEQPYKCKYCDRSFSISSNLQRHVRNIHNKEKPFRCPLCERCFGQQTNLDRHLKRHDSDSGLCHDATDSPRSAPRADDITSEEEEEEDVLLSDGEDEEDEEEDIIVTPEDEDYMDEMDSIDGDTPPSLVNERQDAETADERASHSGAAAPEEMEPTSTSDDAEAGFIDGEEQQQKHLWNPALVAS